MVQTNALLFQVSLNDIFFSTVSSKSDNQAVLYSITSKLLRERKHSIDCQTDHVAMNICVFLSLILISDISI